uniref:Uncharacterized protein AlNc14C29G2768 n=1 Tax=Albugo laibachii Nc14 TaxID=890382 RepID=F0W7F1_9STRA|nr:conserved hypothetical protein [Albugo laibachii Nc14]|eukprot:CCA17052.1 conserved hypothetical protein [Albugo laibachii Nc14]
MNKDFIEQIDAEEDDEMFSDGRYPKTLSTPTKSNLTRKRSRVGCGKSKYSQSCMTSFLHEESPMRIDDPVGEAVRTRKRRGRKRSINMVKDSVRWTQRPLFSTTDGNDEESTSKRSQCLDFPYEKAITNETLAEIPRKHITSYTKKSQLRQSVEQNCVQFPPIQHVFASKHPGVYSSAPCSYSTMDVSDLNESVSWDSIAWLANSKQSEESRLMQNFNERVTQLWCSFLDAEINECTIDQMVSRLAKLSLWEPSRVRTILEVLALSRETGPSKCNLTLLDKYFPIQSSGLVGNESGNAAFRLWLQTRRTIDLSSESESEYSALKSMSKQCSDILVLSGASGVGKSALVHSSANALDINVIEVNSGQYRSRKLVLDIIGEATQSKCIMSELSKRKDSTLLLFDDVDIHCDQDKGFLSAICEVAVQSKCPVVATCTKTPLELRKYVQVPMKALVHSECCLYLAMIAFLEQIPLSYQLIQMVTTAFRCNIRASVHYIQTYLPILYQKRRRQSHLEMDEITSTVWQSHCTDRTQFLLTPSFTWGETLRPYSFVCLRKVTEKENDLIQHFAEKQIKINDIEMLYTLTKWIDDVSLMKHWDEVHCPSEKGTLEKISLDMDLKALRRLSSMCSSSYSVAFEYENTATTYRSIGIEGTLQKLRKCFQTSQAVPNLNQHSVILDYLPYLNQMARATECAQHHRTNRNVSRRNHYLKETLPTMDLLKDLKEVDRGFYSIS